MKVKIKLTMIASFESLDASESFLATIKEASGASLFKAEAHIV